MGTWVQNVGAVDLMSALAPTAVMLALVQTATTLPGLFLACLPVPWPMSSTLTI